MLFNSLIYPFFLIGIVATYYAIPHRFRWALLLTASYYFYGSWKAEYVFLLAFSTLVDYLCALKMEKTESQSARKALLTISIAVNLSVLGLFKYANFFSSAVRDALSQFSVAYHIPELNWILPIGISFYTLQTIGYSIDVYRKRRPAERHLGKFALYVSFFPQLVAGPIERSTRLLPQFFKIQPFKVDNFRLGILWILWGFHKKLIISDHISTTIDPIYANPAQYDSLSLIMAHYLGAFRIYCDFSGYTDIARGSALLFGISLVENFNRPYAATTLRELWGRWHMSLTQWIFNYFYRPLVQNKKDSTIQRNCSLVLVFAVIGFWHGADWNFIIFGLYHGILFMLGGIFSDFLDVRIKTSEFWRRFRVVWDNRWIGLFRTFHIFWVSGVFFTIREFPKGLDLINGMLGLNEVPTSGFQSLQLEYTLGIALIGLLIMEIVQWFHARADVWRQVMELPLVFNWSVYIVMFMSILMFGNLQSEPFQYFQF